MTNEYTPPLESNEEADKRTIAEMRQLMRRYEIADLEGLFKHFNEGEPDDEV